MLPRQRLKVDSGVQLDGAEEVGGFSIVFIPNLQDEESSSISPVFGFALPLYLRRPIGTLRPDQKGLSRRRSRAPRWVLREVLGGRPAHQAAIPVHQHEGVSAAEAIGLREPASGLDDDRVLPRLRRVLRTARTVVLKAPDLKGACGEDHISKAPESGLEDLVGATVRSALKLLECLGLSVPVESASDDDTDVSKELQDAGLEFGLKVAAHGADTVEGQRTDRRAAWAADRHRYVRPFHFEGMAKEVSSLRLVRRSEKLHLVTLEHPMPREPLPFLQALSHHVGPATDVRVEQRGGPVFQSPEVDVCSREAQLQEPDSMSA
eukprot:scaffold2963_cov250-Pinguiococcus_pyrenoidosus.AAC.29